MGGLIGGAGPLRHCYCTATAGKVERQTCAGSALFATTQSEGRLAGGGALGPLAVN